MNGLSSKNSKRAHCPGFGRILITYFFIVLIRSVLIFGNFEFGSSLVGSGGSAFDWYIPSSSSSNGSKNAF